MGKGGTFLTPGLNFEHNAEKEEKEGGGKASLFGAGKRIGRVCINGFSPPRLGLAPTSSVYFLAQIFGGSAEMPGR